LFISPYILSFSILAIACALAFSFSSNNLDLASHNSLRTATSEFKTSLNEICPANRSKTETMKSLSADLESL